LVLEDALHELAGELASPRGEGAFGQTLAENRFGVVTSTINLEQGLQSDYASAASDFHLWTPVF